MKLILFWERDDVRKRGHQKVDQVYFFGHVSQNFFFKKKTFSDYYKKGV